LRKRLKVVSVNLLIFILLLIVTEFLLHIIPPFDRFITYYNAGVRIRNEGANKEYTYIGNNIGTISEFKVYINYNSLGFHDSEHIFPKKENVFRILVLGDSQVEAIQVDLPKTFFKLLEERINNKGFQAEVIALGKSGYGPKEALDLYQNIGRKYDPDLIIWSYTINNDIQDSYPEFQKIIRDRNINDISGIPDFLKFSKIATYLYTRKWIQKNNSSSGHTDTIFSGEFSYINEIGNWDDIVFLKRWPPVFEQVWKSFEKYYLNLIEKIHNDGKKLITISTSGAYPYYLYRTNGNLEWDFDKPNRLVEELSKKNLVKFLSMKTKYDFFIKQTGENVAFSNDGHLNEAGHRLVAEALHLEIKQFLRNRDNNFATENK
jgi:hypothetical protein